MEPDCIIVVDKYLLRKAVKQDSTSVQNFVKNILLEYNICPCSTVEPDIQDIPKFYTYNKGCFEILEDKETKELLGCVGLLRINDLKCKLTKLYLSKKIRGKGIGKMLLARYLSKAKEFGYKCMELETAGALKEAIELYKKFGFKELVPNFCNKSGCDKKFILNLN